ncbi:MAG: DUF2791 family P-loop domain-containing protein [Lachnospiraceae bacterium]|nr:DUF2791 family P-loop domain-containing protein [Lachnospiraceae bacterium]
MALDMMSGQETFSGPLSAEQLLLQGKAPGKGALVGELSEGIDFLVDFWRDKYLQEYIREGGSKIKFVTGKAGSGKSHFLQLFSTMASGQQYQTVDFSANDIWLHDFKEIYLEILRQCDIMECLKKCAAQVVKRMGYRSEEIPEGMTFMDYLSSQDMGDAITRREIRLQLRELFLENPLMDNNFALACSLLTGGILGHPLLEVQNQEILLAWMQGDRTVKLSLVRALGLSPSRITRYNARHMLRSLCEIIRMSGYAGLVVLIDDLEILLSRSSLVRLHYTKMRREDTYESIRQLIDEIDSLRNIMFVFGFDRELFDNENAGVKSYQALWMRIQNEIVGERFNRFGDIVDLDRMAAQEYSPETLVNMSGKLADFIISRGGQASVISLETAKEILAAVGFGGTGIPRMVNEKTLGGGANV